MYRINSAGESIRKPYFSKMASEIVVLSQAVSRVTNASAPNAIAYDICEMSYHVLLLLLKNNLEKRCRKW